MLTAALASTGLKQLDPFYVPGCHQETCNIFRPVVWYLLSRPVAGGTVFCRPSRRRKRVAPAVAPSVVRWWWWRGRHVMEIRLMPISFTNERGKLATVTTLLVMDGE